MIKEAEIERAKIENEFEDLWNTYENKVNKFMKGDFKKIPNPLAKIQEQKIFFISSGYKIIERLLNQTNFEKDSIIKFDSLMNTARKCEHSNFKKAQILYIKSLEILGE